MNFLLGDVGDGIRASVLMSGQVPPLNFPEQGKGTTANNLKRVAFSALDQCFLAVGEGGNTWVEFTLDHGRTWTNLAATIGTALVELDVAIDGAGNVVTLGSGSRDSHEGIRLGYGSWSWAKSVNSFSANPTAGALEYEPTNGKLAAVYRVGLTGMRVDGHGPINGTAWTARTIPANWTSYTGTNYPQIGQGGGTLIAAFLDAGSATGLNVIRSTDGGATWSANVAVTSQAVVSGYGGLELGRPSYDAANGDWYIAVGSTTGTASTEVFRSSNGGATWTSVWYRTASVVFVELQCLGTLLVALNQDGRLAYSIDRGATFKFCGAALKGSAARLTLRAAGGGLFFLNHVDKTSFASLRFGDMGRAL